MGTNAKYSLPCSSGKLEMVELCLASCACLGLRAAAAEQLGQVGLGFANLPLLGLPEKPRPVNQIILMPMGLQQRTLQL